MLKFGEKPCQAAKIVKNGRKTIFFGLNLTEKMAHCLYTDALKNGSCHDRYRTWQKTAKMGMNGLDIA